MTFYEDDARHNPRRVTFTVRPGQRVLSATGRFPSNTPFVRDLSGPDLIQPVFGYFVGGGWAFGTTETSSARIPVEAYTWYLDPARQVGDTFNLEWRSGELASDAVVRTAIIVYGEEPTSRQNPSGPVLYLPKVENLRGLDRAGLEHDRALAIIRRREAAGVGVEIAPGIFGLSAEDARAASRQAHNSLIDFVRNYEPTAPNPADFSPGPGGRDAYERALNVYRNEIEQRDFIREQLPIGLALADFPGSAMEYLQIARDLFRLIAPQQFNTIVPGSALLWVFDRCFGADTPIMMADGSYKPIQNIEVGDSVAAFDPDNESGRGALHARKVVRLFRSESSRLVDLGGLRVTEDHPLLAEDGKFKSLAELGPTDNLVTQNGTLRPVGGWASISGVFEVFNFEVEEFHTYVAGGLRVHNASALVTSGTHSFYARVNEAGRPDIRFAYDSASGAVDFWIRDPESNRIINQRFVQNVVIEAIYENAGQFGPEFFGLGPGGVNPSQIDFQTILMSTPFSRAVLYDAELNTRIELGGDIGYTLGSTLGRLLAHNQLESIVLGAGIGTIARNLGEALVNGGFTVDWAVQLDSSVFVDVFPELGGALVGSISSVLVAELFNALGLEGELAGLGENLANAYISRIAENIVTNAGTFDGLEGINPATIVASYLGARLASELVSFDTVGGQIGASLGASIGTIVGISAAADGAILGVKIGGTAAGPVGAFIGAFVGFIVGGLIGSLFGPQPQSGAELSWAGDHGRFQVGRSWAKTGGSTQSVESIGWSVAQTLNGVLDATRSVLLRPHETRTGVYGSRGKDLVYWATGGAHHGEITLRTRDADSLIRHGAFVALSDILPRLAGGNVFVKRAIAASLRQAGGDADGVGSSAAGLFSLEALLGNISIATDYVRYLENEPLISSMITSNPNSALAAGWAATMASAIDLRLGLRANTDWIGGWSMFLDEVASGEIDGIAFAASTLEFHFDPIGHERYFVFFDEDGRELGSFGDTIDRFGKLSFSATSSDDVLTVTDGVLVSASALTIHRYSGETVNDAQDARRIAVAAYIDGGAGNDTIQGGDLGNDLLGSEGNDVLVGGKLDDWLFGGEGNDRLFAGDANFSFDDSTYAGETAAIIAAVSVDAGNGDLLDGGDGDDRLYGGRGSDWLKGGAGIDILIGGAGGDIIEGGAGNDRGAGGEAYLRGGAGSDQYVFGFDDGQDVAWDESDPTGGAASGQDSLYLRMAGIGSGALQRNWAGGGNYEADGSIRGGEDALVFGIGITFENISLERSGLDLIVKLKAEDSNGQQVLTGDQLTIKDWFESTRRVEWFRFANGEEYRIGDVTTFINGTAANEVIIGTNGSDFIYAGAGDDEVHALAGDDFAFGGAGNDVIGGDEDQDLVAGGSGDDRVFGDGGNDTVMGDAGHDQLSGGDGTDILSGGRGNDTIITGEGYDFIRYARGDGQDVVIDDMAGSWENVWSNNVYLSGFTRDANGIVWRGSEMVFDGVQWIGTYDYDETTHTLRRWVEPAAGATTRDNGTDTIEFAVGINIQDLLVRRNGADLEFAITTENASGSFDSVADRVTLREFFVATGIDRIAFAATGVHDLASYAFTAGATDGADTIIGDATRPDWVTGGLGDDVIEGRGGVDLLFGNGGGDTLRGGGGQDVLFGGAGDDVLDGGEYGDRLFGGDGAFDVASYQSSTMGVSASLTNASTNTHNASNDVYSSIEGLEGSNFADRLTGNAAQNTLRGASGADTLLGGAGDDAYEFSLGDGADTIIEGTLGIQEVISAGGVFNSADFTVTWERLELQYPAPYGMDWQYQLTIADAATGETIYISRPGVDFLYSTPQPNVPSPTEWPFWEGQGINTTRSGNGYQVVREIITHDDGGDDIIEFGEGITLSSLVVTREGVASEDLRIAYGSGDVVTIRNQTIAARAVDGIQLADGVYGDLTHLRLAGEAGTDADDLMLGAAANDTFSGGHGNDVISGGAGSDSLSGGAGDDILEGGSGADTLIGGADLNSSNGAIVQGAPYGDTVRYVGSSGGVTIDLASMTASGGDATGDTISEIENVTGSWSHGDVLRGNALGNRLFGLGGADTLEGRGGDDVLVGGSGNDTLLGGDGEDALTGESGGDHLEGGAGKDLLDGGAGDDTLLAGSEDDMLQGGDGADHLEGQDGEDILAGGTGVDVLLGGAGNDQLSGEDDADSLSGGDGDDILAGGAGADSLQGGLGDDAYVFDAFADADVITDVSGDKNRVDLLNINADQVWLAQDGNDLRVSIIGGTTSIRIVGFFVAGGSRIHQIATADQSLFLSHASDLIAAMSAIGLSAPASMPAAIASLLGDYWHAGHEAAPDLQATVEVSTNEDVVLTGNVGAVDHDENITEYVIKTGPAHGAVTLNASTGAWTYTPNANVHGADTFVLTVADADGHSVDQTVNVTVNAVNDAPENLEAGGALAISENAATGSVIGAFSATDVDHPTNQLTYSLVDDAGGRFRITAAGQLEVATTAINYEAATSHAVIVRVTDAAGGSFDRSFTVNVGNVNETPTAPTVLNQPNAIVGENAASAGPAIGELVVATLSANDPDGTAPTFELVSDAQNWLAIDGANVVFRAGIEIDFEALVAAGWTLSDTDADGAREASYTFSVRATDGALNSTATQVTVKIEDRNEAPSTPALTASGATIVERDRPASGTTFDAINLGSLSSLDPDLASSGDFASLVFSVTDERFEIRNGVELWLKAGAMADLDYEAAASVSVAVTVRDRAGGANGIAATHTLTFNLLNADDVVEGGAGDDVLVGQGNRDRLYGNLGVDALDGAAGDDALFGGAGGDSLTGGAGADTLDGDGDNDVLSGGDGGDVLNGGAGDDVLVGGVGGDALNGGAGIDTISYAGSASGVTVDLATGTFSGGDAAGDSISLADRPEAVIGSGFADVLTGSTASETIDGAGGADTIVGGGGADHLLGGSGNDQITGGADADVIDGGDGDDVIWGGSGNDTLNGGAGNDVLRAELGDDVLNGGVGNDTLIGGENNDTYFVEANSGTDTIENFDMAGVDTLSFVGMAASDLWFERSDGGAGNDLIVTAIEKGTVVRIKDWFVSSDGEAKLDFLFDDVAYIRTIDIDALVTLMNAQTKPLTQAAYQALLSTNGQFQTDWMLLWQINELPDLQPIDPVTANEDTRVSVVVTVQDDLLLPGQNFAVELRRAGEATVIATPTLTVTALSGGQFRLEFDPPANVSGVLDLRVRFTDVGGLQDVRDTALTLIPVADTPNLLQPSPTIGAGATKATLDGGSIGLAIQASLNDLDGSEILEVRIGNVASGLGFNQGTNLGGGVWSFTPTQLATLALTGAAGWATDLTGGAALTVTAIARETANSSQTSTTQTMSFVINARPTAINTSATSVSENATAAVVATLSAIDPDAQAGETETFVYTLVSDASARFEVVGNQLRLRAGVTLDYETMANHTIRVRVTDSGGLSYERDLTIATTNVNEAPNTPVLSSGAGSLIFNENVVAGASANIGLYVASDVDGTTPSFSVLYPSTFNMVEFNGSQLRVSPGAMFDFEAWRALAASGLYWYVQLVDANGDGRQEVQISVPFVATDGALSSATQWATLLIRDVNEAPTSLSPNGALTVAENSAAGTVVRTFTRVDPDANDTATYWLDDSAGGRFAINSTTGVITVLGESPLNFEAAQSHNITVRVTDAGGFSYAQVFSVSLSDVNEAPTTPTIQSGGTLILQELGSLGGLTIATLTATDPEGTAPTFWESYDPFGVAVVEGNQIRTIMGLNIGFDYWFNYVQTNAPRWDLQVTDFDGDNIKEISWAIGAYASDGALSSPASAWTWLSIEDTNQAPVVTGRTHTVSEATAGAGVAGALFTFGWSDADTQGYNRDPRFAITDANGNAISTPFSINATTGQLFLQNVLNYEAQNQYTFYVQITDRGGTGLSHRAPVTINVGDSNEQPTLQQWYGSYTTQYTQQGSYSGSVSVTWDDSTAGFAGPYTYSVDGIVETYVGAGMWFVGESPDVVFNGSGGFRVDMYEYDYQYEITIRVTDAGGASSTFVVYTSSNASPWGQGGGWGPPIVLDLDGDGLELVGIADSAAYFDMDDDGVRDRTGWAGADDGLLAFDRDGSGAIDRTDEIQFGADLESAVSDLEGLRAFDTNQNGFFDTGDADFAGFRVWQDANQDGVSQAGELTTLASRNISAINLTLTLNPNPNPQQWGNILYGTTQYVRGDGTTGAVGDVMFYYATNRPPPAFLPPILFDFDGDGFDIVSRRNAEVLFDVRSSGQLLRTDWVAPSDGILALDRNGDGQITSGSEISFRGDLAGAMSDLEGLRAFDTDANGFFDGGDAQFGAFRVWRDLNQDGVSQDGELSTLAAAGVAAISLTLQLTGATTQTASSSVVYATAAFVRTDGTSGQVGDVFLAYDQPSTPDPSVFDPLDPDFDPTSNTSRTADQGSAAWTFEQWINRQRAAQGGDPGGGDSPVDFPSIHPRNRGRSAEPQPFAFIDDEDQSAFDAADRLRDARANRLDTWMGRPDIVLAFEGDGAVLGPNWQSDERFDTGVAITYQPTGGRALHNDLGMADRTVLQMIDAIAAFDVRAGIETPRNQLRDRGRQSPLLTALPNLK